MALPGGVRFTAVQLGCFAAGAVFVPIPAQSTAHEAGQYLELTTPDLIVVQSLAEQAPVLEAVGGRALVVVAGAGAPGALDGPARQRPVSWEAFLGGEARPLAGRPPTLPPATRTLQFTSGSSGRPKAILIAEQNWSATLDQNHAHLERFRGRHVFCPLPQFHAMGNAVVVEHLLHGSPVHLANQFAPARDVERMRRHRCAGLLSSPNYLKLMRRLGALAESKLPDLDWITIGTAAIDEALIQEVRQALPRTTVFCRYGLSESVGALARHVLPPGTGLARRGLVGKPVPGVEVAPLPRLGEGEPAELRVRSAANAIGQLRERGQVVPLVDAEGFLATGDLASLDAEGNLYLGGRISSFLKCNGYRVNPFEIEEVLRALPAVQEAVVVGVPDPLTGQRIVACLEPGPAQELPGPPALLHHCEANLSAHKVPQRFLPLAPLPRTPAGKPDRGEILRRATEALAAATGDAAEPGAGGSRLERVWGIVARVVAENVGQAVELDADTDLEERGWLDSMTLVSLVVALQDELEIAIPVGDLAPARFASITAIVALLDELEGGGALAAPVHAAAPPESRPTFRLVMTLALALVLGAIWFHAPSDVHGPLNARAFHLAKAGCRGCADVVIAGSSQASVNLAPAAVAASLPGATVMNLGFSTQPYSPIYLDGLEEALRSGGLRTIVLIITPVSLTAREGDDGFAYWRSASRARWQEVRAALEDLRARFRPRSPCELAFRLCDRRVDQWLHPDGWSAMALAGLAPDAGVAPMARYMRRWGHTLRITAGTSEPLFEHVARWRRSGIAVFAVLAPVAEEMRLAELELPGWDEAAIGARFRAAGAAWLTPPGGSYPTFDGWHMERPVAVRFSTDLGQLVARGLRDQR